MIKIKRHWIGLLAIVAMIGSIVSNLLWIFFICWGAIGILALNDSMIFFNKEEFLKR